MDIPNSNYMAYREYLIERLKKRNTENRLSWLWITHFIYYEQTERASATLLEEHNRALQNSKVGQHANHFSHNIDFDPALLWWTKLVITVKDFFSRCSLSESEMTFRIFTSHSRMICYTVAQRSLVSTRVSQ